MSDDERLNLRDLPAVPTLAGWPDRYSQTLLAKADRCLRSAYLYVKYRGGTPSHELDRGTAFHLFAERFMQTLVAAGEPTLYAAEEGEDPVLASRAVASLTADMVDEILRERSDLTVPRGQADDVREMAYHLAVGNDIDPLKVVAIERKFVIDLAGHEVSGKIDVAQLADDVAQVDDYKTTFAVPDQEVFEDSFQGWLYALLLLFGHPVEKVLCGDCHSTGRAAGADTSFACVECGGRGYVERREPPLGERVQWVRVRMLFPRYLLDDGTLQQRSVVLSRTQVNDFRHDVERTIARVDQARETGKFPAVAGAHCVECPCATECPLPKHLRRWAGAINDMEQAAEVAEWLEVWKPRIAASEKELKNFADKHGPIRYGRDKVREFVLQEGRAVKKVKGRSAWDELAQAIALAATFGEPFDLAEWVKSTSSMRFVARRLTPDELVAAGAREEVAERDFGDDPPF
jgi:hypothetical protein